MNHHPGQISSGAFAFWRNPWALEHVPCTKGQTLRLCAMKILPALLSSAIALFMVSGTSPIVKRSARNPDIYNSLSDRQKELVQQGRVEEGMTKKAVFLAWGKPDRAAQGSKSG